MATAISKKQMLSALCSFLGFIGGAFKIASITCGIVFFIFIILPIWWVFDVVAVLTSPVWFPIRIWWDNKKAAEIINVPQEPDTRNFFEELCDGMGLPFQNWCNTVLLRKLWSPVVDHLPMKYRDWFIFTGQKAFSEYPVATQLEYWNYEHDELVRTKLICDGIKENGVVHRLSGEALMTLWATDSDVRRLWIEGGKQASQKQFNELISEHPKWLEEHLLGQTPSNTVWSWLIDSAENGDLYALELVKRLVEQAMPKPSILVMIFSCKSNVSRAVAEIIDKKADKRATILNVVSRFPAVKSEIEDSELEKNRREAGEKEVKRWENFCKVKDKIDVGAQDRMSPWQYFIFAETGHHLNLFVLQKALYNLKYRGWVEKLMKNEWDKMEDSLILPLIKADNDLYNLYLELKVENK